MPTGVEFSALSQPSSLPALSCQVSLSARLHKWHSLVLSWNLFGTQFQLFSFSLSTEHAQLFSVTQVVCVCWCLLNLPPALGSSLLLLQIAADTSSGNPPTPALSYMLSHYHAHFLSQKLLHLKFYIVSGPTDGYDPPHLSQWKY